MSVPWQPAPHGRGLLLLRGTPEAAARWVSRGLVAAHVVPLSGWTGVVPVESLARPPYDDPLAVLAVRPVSSRLRPSLGVFAVAGRAVVAVQPAGWRPVPRWLVWQPGRGVVRAPGLRDARRHDLLAAAGAVPRGRQAAEALGAVLGDPRRDALGLVAEVMDVLGLPGAGLFTGTDAPEAHGRLVEPVAKEVARFDARMLEEARHRAELEED